MAHLAPDFLADFQEAFFDMRCAIATVMLGVITAYAAAGAMIPLQCEVSGKYAEELCAAMLRDLGRRSGADFADPVSLVLHAESPRADLLRARLDVVRDGEREAGKTGSLSIMDTRQIPADTIDRFAAAMIERTGLFNFTSPSKVSE